MRRQRAEVLNSHGRLLQPYVVGQYVKIYISLPPSHSEAVRRRRKCKHICQWRGPLQISKALSNTTFEMISFFNKKRVFRRHVSNIRRWRGPLPATNEDDSNILPFASDTEVGEFAFIHDADFDTDSSMMLHLVQISTIDDQTVVVAVWGTTSKNPATGVYRPVQILERSRLPTTKPRRNQRFSPWTWQLPLTDIDDRLVLRQVDITQAGKLTAETRRRLKTRTDRERGLQSPKI